MPSNYRDEFPDFDPATMPTIPPGFVDASWKNDVCPHFWSEVRHLAIWVDYAEAERREYPECPRFTLSPTDADGATGDAILSTDDWSALLEELKSEFILLRDGAAWDALAKENAEALTEQYGSIEKARAECKERGLTMGGGAAPLFRIRFIGVNAP